MYFFYFYPVGINAKKHRQPVLSWSLMVFMLVAFLWQEYFPSLISLNPADLVFYPGSGQPWTVLTAIFMHAGWVHLLGNLVYFNVFAPVLESRVGPFMFVVYFLVIGVFGNLVHGAVSYLGWFGQYGVGVLGASGSIAGLLAFSLVRFHHSRVDIAWWVFAPLMGQNRAGRSKVPLLVAVVLWLLLQVVQSLVASQTGASVSFGAHFGGFFMGLVLALSMGQWREGKQEGLRLKAAEYFKRRPVTVHASYSDVFRNFGFEKAREIGQDMIQRFMAGELDAVYMCFNEFKSAIAQDVVVQKLLPLERIEATESHHEYLYEPPPEELLDALLHRHVNVQLWAALLESNAAENGARMSAMDAATKNAGELIDKLTLQMNRIRQAAITREIIEVVSGADALG